MLHVTNFFDSTLGYTEYYLAKKQSEFGLGVKVVCSNYPMQGKKTMPSGLTTEDGISIIRLNTACNFRGNIWAFNPITLAKILKAFLPDVVHCHGFLSPLSQEILLLKRRYRFLVVGDLIRGVGTDSFSRIAEVFATQMLKHFLEHWFSDKVDAFFACTKAVENWMRNSLKSSASKIFFIPLGADHRLFKPDSRERVEIRALLDISPDDVVAIYTGKLLPSKRIHDLLAASRIVINQYENFKILLVGDCPSSSYRERLRTLIDKLGISHHILAVKTVHRRKLKEFYNAADFAIWPGGFSISIIEAMACGLPIIIPKSNWTAHYLEYMNGFSFKAGDIHSLSSILLRSVEDPKLRKLFGARSRKLVEDKLNWDSIAKQYIEIYRSCLRNMHDSYVKL